LWLTTSRTASKTSPPTAPLFLCDLSASPSNGSFVYWAVTKQRTLSSGSIIPNFQQSCHNTLEINNFK
jgi:hypothetical protein